MKTVLHPHSFLVILLFLSTTSSYLTAAEPLNLRWEKEMLTISGASIPGESIQVWYLEAFCRSHATRQPWDKTTIPHKTELLSSTPTHIHLQTRVEPNVVVDHEITSGTDEVQFQVTIKNSGKDFADVQWFQPCMRVDRFTGGNQENYIKKSFIYTKNGLSRLSDLPREEEAIYHGGQVYVPKNISLEEVNPRPISKIQPINGLIGCFSQNEQSLVAMAWNNTQELFQGVIVCLHNDPRVGGLKPGETKQLKGKIYLLPNNSALLLKRYNADFK